MNIAIIYGGRSSSCPKLEKLSKALAKGLEEQSHMVKVLNAYVDTDQRLSYFDFIIVGSEPMGLLSAKVPEQIRNFLRVVPGAGGKRCLSFISGGLRANGTFQNLMKIMETEGMFLTVSEVIGKEGEAYVLGKHLKLERY